MTIIHDICIVVIGVIVLMTDIMGRMHARRHGKDTSFYRTCDLTLSVLLVFGTVAVCGYYM